jgi:hypothetical protein
MAGMSQPTETPEPEARPEGADPEPPGSPGQLAPGLSGGSDGSVPGEPGAPRRRLERAPGERLARPVAAPADGDAGSVGSPTRAVQMGILGAALGIAVFLILAIGFSFSAGLLIVAIFTGRFIGLFVRAGAAGTLSAPARALVSIVIFLVALSAAVVVTWLWSHVEGGDLGLADYLDQVYGIPLVALEFMLGTLMAWWSAR